MSLILMLLRTQISIVTSIIMAFTGIMQTVSTIPFKAQQDDVLLNVALFSDTHLDYREYIGQGIVSAAVKSLSGSETPIDGIVISGDLTNYGDEKSVERMYQIFTKYKPEGAELFAAMGNHDVGHVSDLDITAEEARQNFYALTEKYLGRTVENIYFSAEIKGYKFIALGDEGDDTWDHPVISDAQLSFLDSELAGAVSKGKPVFVISHWPLNGMNGQEEVWEGGGMGDYSDSVQAVLEKYPDKNVFFISGHLHEGVNGGNVHGWFDIYNVEEQNGVTYVNLPAMGSLNRYGVMWPGTGMQMEVYDDEVVFRGRNYVIGEWFPERVYSVELH